jgi:hypothetical protein
MSYERCPRHRPLCAHMRERCDGATRARSTPVRSACSSTWRAPSCWAHCTANITQHHDARHAPDVIIDNGVVDCRRCQLHQNVTHTHTQHSHTRARAQCSRTLASWLAPPTSYDARTSIRITDALTHHFCSSASNGGDMSAGAGGRCSRLTTALTRSARTRYIACRCHT